MGQFFRAVLVLAGMSMLGLLAIRWSNMHRIESQQGAPLIAQTTPPTLHREPAGWWSWSPRQMFDKFDANELGAEGEFKGKRVRIVGLVGSVQRDGFGGAYLTLQAGPPKKASRQTSLLMQMEQAKGQFIRCDLRPEALAQASRLVNGSLVAVEGRGRMLDALELAFSDCDVTWIWSADDRIASLSPSLLARQAEFCVAPRVADAMGVTNPDGVAVILAEAAQAELALADAGVATDCDHPLLPLVISCEGETSRPECRDFIMKANGRMAQDERAATKSLHRK